MLISAKLPRRPINDPPSWGIVHNIMVPTSNNKLLETWIVYPKDYQIEFTTEIPRSKNCVILFHGSGRNRDRMVSRSKIFHDMGYTTIMFYARDHGKSQRSWYGASIVQFYQDLEAIVIWWGSEVIVYGHSLGGAGALIAAGKSPLIKGLILDATPSEYPYDLKFALRPFFGKLTWLFLPGSEFALRLYNFKFKESEYNPGYAAKLIEIPVLIFHGVHDHIYPPSCAEKSHRNIKNSELIILEKANHSTVHAFPIFKEKIITFLEKNT